MSGKMGPVTVNSRGRATTHVAPGLSYVHQTPKRAKGTAVATPTRGRAAGPQQSVSHLVNAASAAGYTAGLAKAAQLAATGTTVASAVTTGSTPPDTTSASALSEQPDPPGIDELAELPTDASLPQVVRRPLGMSVKTLWWIVAALALVLIGSLQVVGVLLAVGVIVAAAIIVRRAPWVTRR